jgi:hypothetical protein
VVKISSSGSILWQKSTTTGVYDIIVSGLDIKVASSGNIYISGTYAPFINIDPDRALTLKLDSSGNFVWGRSFQIAGSSANSPYVISLDSSENVYTQSVHSSPSRVLTKMNSSGTLNWRVSNPFLAIRNMFTDSNGNSHFVSEGNFSTVVALGRINTNGTRTLRVTTPSGHKFKDVVVDSSGNSYVAGTRDNSEQVVEVAKFSSSGARLWSRSLSSASFPSSTNVQISLKGNALYLLVFGVDGSPQTILCKISVDGLNLGISNNNHKVENVTITADVGGPKAYSANEVATALSSVSVASTTESFTMVNTAFTLVDSPNGEFYNRSFAL